MNMAVREEFDAKSARTRQPLPLWAGAFDRATKEHTPEIIGAYMLILLAMWESKSCDLPDNEKHLAWVAKVSPTVWRRRIAPIIIPLLSRKNSRIFSEKLTENAQKVEDYCRRQFERKSGKSETKSLKENKRPSTTDQPRINHGSTTDGAGADPKPSTFNLKEIDDDSARAREKPISLKKRLAEAMGLDPEDATICDEAGMAEVKGWMKGYGLRSDEIVSVVAEVMAKRPDKSPPSSLTYFAKEMARLAEAKASKPEKPAPEKRAEAAPPATEDQIMRFYANWINSDRPIPASTLKPNTARAMLDAGLVTPDQLRAKGIAH